MRVTNVAFEQLEKERSNSPEDSFVRSTVTYEQNGKMKTFHVLYPVIFAERAIEEGVWSRESTIHEAVALNLLPQYPGRKRLYLSGESEFLSSLKEADLSELFAAIQQIKLNGSYEYS
ncbi:hypothetical protein ABFG93_20210 [Pseudalkalibacillus hwajinpoensis]|uniref:hypothetical protein n=1 Tax=Guptibacillus hwajinpoensis TaxID=208199 RepID=UPI00325AC985